MAGTKYVYLAGPVSGFDYEKATTWRQLVAQVFRDTTPDVRAIDPLRGITEDDYRLLDHGMYDNKSCACDHYMERDFMDIRRSSMLFVNLIGAERVSIGTMMEMGFAKALGIPMVLAIDAAMDNPHLKHPWVRDLPIHKTTSVHQAVMFCIQMLSEEGYRK